MHVPSAFRIVVAATVLAACPGTAAAQRRGYYPRPATSAEVLAGNLLVGGLTAATRAVLSGKDPFRAFGIGALGGAVYLAGKNLAVEPGAPNGWLGLALAGAGTSMVSNAGRGVSPFDELSVPIAAARLRFTPRAGRKVRFALLCGPPRGSGAQRRPPVSHPGRGAP